jgi:hypothetical protein
MKKLVYFVSALVLIFLSGCASYNPEDFVENNPDVKRVVAGKFLKTVVVEDKRSQVGLVDGVAGIVGPNPTTSPTVGTIAAGLSALDYVTKKTYGQIFDMYVQVEGEDDPVVFHKMAGLDKLKNMRAGDDVKVIERKDGRYLVKNMSLAKRLQEEKSAQK